MVEIYVPLAEVPSKPTDMNADRLTGVPDFSSYVERIAGLQEKGRQVQEVASEGRQLCYLALARLQRSDTHGATAAFAAIEALPSLEASMGPTLWADVPQRLQLCQSNGVAYFVELYVASLAFSSFLERGVLTPGVPPAWRIGVEDYDDELYLLGVIGGLRELERYAVNRGQALDLRSIRLCLGAAQSLEEGLMQFSFRNSDLRQRFDGVKYCVKKLEALAYEVDLALQRRAATTGAAAVGSAATSGDIGAESRREDTLGVSGPGADDAVIDAHLIADIKSRYDRFDAQREEVMKRSRDVIKSAKNAIYALQRADYKKADTFLEQCTEAAVSIHGNIISECPRLRDGFFGSALEEYAEAQAYRAFRRDRRLMSLEEMQSASGLSFNLSMAEYLGGIMDLTGEVGRLAIRSASKGRTARADVELCLACVDAVYNGIQELPALPGRINKKISPLKSTLTKIEGALYELALLSHGVSARVDPAFGESEETD